jgi:hypothetical protein
MNPRRVIHTSHQQFKIRDGNQAIVVSFVVSSQSQQGGYKVQDKEEALYEQITYLFIEIRNWQ